MLKRNGTGRRERRPNAGRGLGRHKTNPEESQERPGERMRKRWISRHGEQRRRPIKYSSQQVVSLTDLPVGSSGIITAIHGGHGFIQKLDALGLCEGKEIIKISRQWMKGPVIVRIGSTEIALGYSMAHRIIVQTK